MNTQSKRNFLGKYFQSGLFWWGVIITSLFTTVLVLHFLKAGQDGVHYHANFKIYVNGQPVLFDKPDFYEEETACSIDNLGSPSSRGHLHDNQGHLIHVHDHAVTYQHFLANLGIYVTDNSLEVFEEVYVVGNRKRLRFILNGRPLVTLNNKVIRSKDVLLIDYSADQYALLQQRYDTIPEDAEAANQKNDPGSCTGNTNQLSFWEKLKRTLGL